MCRIARDGFSSRRFAILGCTPNGIRGTFCLPQSSLAEIKSEGAMIKLPEKVLRDEAEMRSFYQSVGISPETIELAIVARRNRPATEDKPAASLPKGRKRKGAAARK